MSFNCKKSKSVDLLFLLLVPVAGVEPARYRYQRILSPPRLPIPTHRRLTLIIIYHAAFVVKSKAAKFSLTQPYFCDILHISDEGVASAKLCSKSTYSPKGLACFKLRDLCISFFAVHEV